MSTTFRLTAHDSSTVNKIKQFCSIHGINATSTTAPKPKKAKVQPSTPPKSKLRNTMAIDVCNITKKQPRKTYIVNHKNGNQRIKFSGVHISKPAMRTLKNKLEAIGYTNVTVSDTIENVTYTAGEYYAGLSVTATPK